MKAGRTSPERGGAAERSALGRILALCRENMGTSELGRELRPRLQRLVPFAAYCLNTADPQTLAATSAVGDGLPSAAASRLYALESAGTDINPLAALARSPQPVATAHEATGGELVRSLRMAEIFLPMGLHDELRAALLIEGQCWGFLHLFRAVHQPPFSPQDRALIGALSRPLARSLRAALVRESPAAPHPEGPGLLLLGEGHTLTSVDDRAAGWLRDLSFDENHPIPHIVLEIAARARQMAAAPARGLARTRGGAWLELQGVRLGPQVAVILDRPRPDRLAPLLLLAHGLSPRQRAIAQLITRGLSNDEIALALGLSTHTVKDHLKAILTRTATSSRGELTARLNAVR